MGDAAFVLWDMDPNNLKRVVQNQFTPIRGDKVRKTNERTRNSKVV
jgi:hypothetical protein